MKTNMLKLTEYNKNNIIEEQRFERFYQLLSSSLPKEEYRSYEGQKELFKKDNYKLFLLEDGQEVNALLTAWELNHLRFVEHLAVSSNLQGQGIGGKLIESYTNRDSRKVVLEVELPETKKSIRRINFYKRCGFHLNEYPYKQVPLNEGDSPLPLYLMTFPEPLDHLGFKDMKKTLYKQVYDVEVI